MAANQNHSTNRIYEPQRQRVLAAPGQCGVARPPWPRALPGRKLPEVGCAKVPIPHFLLVLRLVSVLT